ncbi:ABC transporter substrate-binding protein [Desulfurivibrio alkaliphilus]|uniref:Periplasmic binding protein n=1 Tax=Desulfurivibrio alkaliphilus (strain DSM 19089 / UNIQEM U267 / AHT2) TaxID=589865 RepID=D6Z3X8_DESAT|nr:cobalamin-binding protein [Desulfurivibrio alkaliphilus]ADH86253.1 periplasmic binding protein [Desulfurivibrio alkaliphilus AHT 2]
MNRPFTTLFLPAAQLLLVLLLLLPAHTAAGAGQAAGTELRQLADPTGREVSIPATPRRVVSLAPSITEMIFALEQQELLLGTTQFSNYPPAAREIPRIGSYVLPDLERIVALSPDLVLATRDGNPRRLINRLEALGIPVFAIDPRNLAEIKTSLLVLGEVLNATDQANALATDIEQRLAQLQAQMRHIEHRPLVFFQVDAAPMVSIGEETFLHELIELAGGRNAAAGGPAYPRYGWEEILNLQPEVVIITSMAGGQSPEELLRMWQRWPQLQAVQNNRLHVVDADLFDRPTHRLLDGLEILAKLIHPGQDTTD